MQRTSMYSPYQHPSDLLRRMMIDNAASGSRESSDALVQRILDEAANKRPPMGLFDPREADSSQAPVPAAFRAALPSAVDPQDIHALTPPSTSDALVQRILDEAASKRPPMGLFDPREAESSQAPVPADFRAAYPSVVNPQDIHALTPPSTSDALVQRILDEAASKRPPMGLFDPRGSERLQTTSPSDVRSAFPTPADPQFPSTRSGSDALVQRILDSRSPTDLADPRGFVPWPTTYNTTPSTPSGERSPGVISFIPPIAPPPGLAEGISIAERAAPAARVIGFDFSPIDYGLAANALGRAAYQGIGESFNGIFAPNQPSTSMSPQSNPVPVPYGELTDFEIVKRIPGGGASDSEAYRHWYEGSGNPLRIEFSDANVEDDLRRSIGESAAGGLASTFRNQINRSLFTGRPAPVDTTAPVNTGDIVRGRTNTRLTGWVTANSGKWQFDGTATGKPEPFDFNSDPRRGFLTNAGTIYFGDRGHLYGAKDYEATYSGAIQMRAGGPIRR